MDDALRDVGTQIDKLITLDLDARGVVDQLYAFAHAQYGLPLCANAAERLHDVLCAEASRVVFIATGFADRPDIDPAIAETDGPPGAVALARALHLAYKAAPVLLVEERNLEANRAVLEAAGLRCLTVEQAVAATKNRAPLHAGAVLGFPTDPLEAKIAAECLIEAYAPAAVICTEKGSMNRKGLIHTTRGHDVTADQAKIDLLMQEAAARGILTIGVGDGGNEVGMGVLEDKIRASLPYGAVCQCPCGGGFAPYTPVDALIVAGVSNWGCYGLCACIAILSGERRALHGPELEELILASCARNHFIDGRSGFTEPSVDGIPCKMHMQVVDILGRMVDVALAKRASA